ncbi:MAG TPA: ATP-binding protein [Lacibacter sp.]|nr:ATP-binding protein [Lacibacter sp.]HMO90450.1 ATP-binding protein [Lacibacter sp.]
MEPSLRKIVILGPESTGKSTLCEQLAAHYQTLWCPEYAREYLLKHGTNYSFEDLLNIAKGQLQLEDSYTAQLSQRPTVSGQLLFIDTDMYVMKVWCEFVFNDCHRWILDRIAERRYDLYLLCRPDLPWVKDELREYPDEATRLRLYHYYRELLMQQDTPWVEVSGSYDQRLQQAIAAVDRLPG